MPSTTFGTSIENLEIHGPTAPAGWVLLMPSNLAYGGATVRVSARSDLMSCVSNGDGCITVMRRGSVAISLTLDSDTGFKKSNRAASARQRVASCKPWQRRCVPQVG